MEYRIVGVSLITTTKFIIPPILVYWAIRGGGAASWGVITSVTLRTFPTFDAVSHSMFILANTSDEIGKLTTIHAQHIFDWDEHRASQYWFILTNRSGLLPPGVGPIGVVALSTFPNTSVAAVNASLAPFLNATAAAGFAVFTSLNVTNVNDAMTFTTDSAGDISIQGSRLIPADVYRNNSTGIGNVVKKLLDMNTDAYVMALV
jgi:hypothetical protein